MPAGAVYVGRPTVWGNPFAVGHAATSRKEAVQMYRDFLTSTPEGAALLDRARVELAGKDLVCWCPPADSCHADVLLEVANGG
jgi:hypothetical protein